MGRLTTAARQVIAERAVRHAFAEREAALKKAEDLLAREAFDAVVPVAEQKLAKKLPEYWLRRDDCLRFNAGGYDVTLSVIGEGLPVPYAPDGSRGGYSCNRLGNIPHGDLCDRIQAHVKASDEIKLERRSAYKATLAMLEAIQTTNKLREVWPEGEQFFLDYADAVAPSLPAIRVSEVNALLGLAA
jgi:hypothetical protein